MIESLCLYVCPDCGVWQLVKPSAPTISCMGCGYYDASPVTSSFGHEEWETSDDFGPMWMGVRKVGSRSPRKDRLMWCAIARVYIDRCHDRWFGKAIEYAEQWADAGNPPEGASVLRDYFESVHAEPRDEDEMTVAFHTAAVCLADKVDEELFPLGLSVVAHCFREFYPNPFVPLAWNPDWLTSTVRDLAAHIYEAREFTTMPILADALQDAGCDNEQILTHCRANKPHARGCWVLDAILGKA